MKGITHMTGGALAASAVIALAYPNVTPTQIGVIFASGIIGGLLPDIDHPNSKISHKLRVSSKLVHIFCSHRGLFHSPAFYLILGGIIAALPQLKAYSYIILAFLAGAFSHLLLDSLNPMGIPFFWPVTTKKYSIAKIGSGGVVDSIVGGICLLAAGIITYKTVI